MIAADTRRDFGDKAVQDIVSKVEKLLRLAERGGTEAEAAAAAAKAQELLASYNLDLATVERASGADGRREDHMQRGGMYRWQRELWGEVASLNFCWYFSTRRKIERRSERRSTDGTVIRKAYKPWSWQHRLVGRVVNTTSTRHMALYLEQTIERLTRERLGQNWATQQFSTWAVAYREGMADRIIRRVQERRWSDERRRETEAADRAARAGVSTERALTLADVADREHQANYDFLHGEGAYARKQEREAARERRQQAAQQAAEEAATAWAAAHPEEAAREAKRERARERAAARREYRPGRERGPSARERRADSGAYQSGWDAAEGIGLDPQTEQRQQRRIARG